ncbi:MAG: DNA-directed RNA polymerase subunit beta [Chlorobi bacterium]|nr:DNA-directed RNA polymerase subunit beta [Chlorobiota bacterium]MBX7217558.1 DNA-directed RNA polymerase subunit beta [Candidatus Kapabacteria bacterium]
MPDLLDVQVAAYREFLQADIPPAERKMVGLQSAFAGNFPITDAREIFTLEYLEYRIERPKYSEIECRDRELTFAVPLKARLRLSSKAEPDSDDFIETVEQEVYLGNIPMMTERGTFIINGAERVVVSQLHRSPGVFFSDAMHPNGTRIFSARIIPFRGSWVEFTTDIQNVMYAYIDRKKKFPVTTLLRALGFSSDDDLLQLFNLTEDVAVSELNADFVDRVIAGDVIDMETGEIIIGRDAILTEELIVRFQASGAETVQLYTLEASQSDSIIVKTIQKDIARSEEDALEAIYRQLRSGEAPDLETARALIEKLFFNPKRYDLGEVGRHRINQKLGLGIPSDQTTLTREDIVSIIKYLIDLQQGKRQVDDIDHLGNRRVRTVGEQLAAQVNIGMARMGRTIKERMNIHDAENFTPSELVNARTVTSVINTFFGTNQLSQFMDQTNPLAETTNKRRMSALGPGGLTRERAGFEVRDVHYTHYGRLCPIETPEGPNIGLISSLCIYARINGFGFLETPYRKVVDGRVTDDVEYISADLEEGSIIATATIETDKDGNITVDRVRARQSGDFVMVEPHQIQYADIAPNQMVSAAAAMIPFLEHDDANRALMGSNMQRQAVPLLRPERPIVGTGMEWKIARDSRTLIVAERDGVVKYVDSTKIIVEYDQTLSKDDQLVSFVDDRVKEYPLVKFFRTNQDTCINQRPLVREGQRVAAGDVLVDGSSTKDGELALGRNLLVAFMPWRGYNFEDAIVISERVVSEDIYTSVHIEEFTTHVRDTKRGEEELTREIPNVSEEAVRNLDEAGMIRIGSEATEGDILVGKITPKGETDPTPEEKLLRAIFGDKAGDVKDASLKTPPGIKGVVIQSQLFSRRVIKKDTDIRKDEKKRQEMLDRKLIEELDRYSKMLAEKLGLLLDGETSLGIRDESGTTIIRAGTGLKADTFTTKLADGLDVGLWSTEDPWVENKRKNSLVRKAYQNFRAIVDLVQDDIRIEKNKVAQGDELQPGILQMAKVYVAKKRKLQVGDKMAGRHGNKGVVAKIVSVEDMPFLPDGTPIDIVLNPLGVPSRMNLGQLYETALGWAGLRLGVRFATPIFDGARWGDVMDWLEKAGLDRSAKTDLYDGRSGERFDQQVTVGVIYMLKLSHLVEDKIHARSIGPYSLITQQPLGGKAQFGGQRFGEMEVWALEAYGASNVLQEILTVKSDDVHGRSKSYESIVKGENLPEPNIPESFNVLVRELQGLGLEVKID